MKMQRLAQGLLALAFCATVAAPAIAADKTAPAYKAPRNSLGQPDLEGSWTNATITPTARQAKFGTRATYTAQEAKDLENQQQEATDKGNAPTADNTKPITGGVIAAHGGIGIDGNYNRGWFDPGSSVMRVHGEPRNSLLTTPNGQYPPRKAGAAPLPPFVRPAAAGRYDNPEQLGLGDQCIISFGRNGGPPMFPNGFYNNNYQVVQSRDSVAIDIEMVHDTRVIRLNGTHRTDGVRPWFGDSIGHYEGDTLVVETTNIPQRQNYNGAWEHLKVTERFTRVAKDRLLYQFTVDDPTLWDKPWGGEYEFGALNGRLQEYACHEGNYALEGILAGARQEEKASEEPSKKAVAAK
jgi:hypothetical protein